MREVRRSLVTNHASRNNVPTRGNFSRRGSVFERWSYTVFAQDSDKRSLQGACIVLRRKGGCRDAFVFEGTMRRVYTLGYSISVSIGRTVCRCVVISKMLIFRSYFQKFKPLIWCALHALPRETGVNAFGAPVPVPPRLAFVDGIYVAKVCADSGAKSRGEGGANGRAHTCAHRN